MVTSKPMLLFAFQALSPLRHRFHAHLVIKQFFLLPVASLDLAGESHLKLYIEQFQ